MSGSRTIPEQLADLIRGYDFKEHPYNESGARIFELTSSKGERLYLKVRIGDQEQRLLREYTTLSWIDDRLPTPKALYHSTQGELTFLLTTGVRGTPVYQVPEEDRRDAVLALAEGLALIHEQPGAGCPHVSNLEVQLGKARKMSLSEEGEQLLHRLLTEKPRERLAFTHGDYCLPNVLVTGRRLEGIIDWDSAGLADPYVDLASAAWSIQYNFGDEAEALINIFFEAYGEEVDEGKLGYYLDLMKLFQ